MLRMQQNLQFHTAPRQTPAASNPIPSIRLTNRLIYPHSATRLSINATYMRRSHLRTAANFNARTTTPISTATVSPKPVASVRNGLQMNRESRLQTRVQGASVVETCALSFLGKSAYRSPLGRGTCQDPHSRAPKSALTICLGARNVNRHCSKLENDRKQSRRIREWVQRVPRSCSTRPRQTGRRN